MSDIEHPPCAACGGPVSRKHGEGPSKYLLRKACSSDCLHTLLRRNGGRPKASPYQHPPCIHCGGAVRYRNSESREYWISREYCSVRCQREAEAINKGWPEITGSELRGTPFAAYDTDPGDGLITKYNAPATHVETATVLGGN